MPWAINVCRRSFREIGTYRTLLPVARDTRSATSAIDSASGPVIGRRAPSCPPSRRSWKPTLATSARSTGLSFTSSRAKKNAPSLMTLGASRKYSCMNPVGRKCVHVRPDLSTYSSISLCIRPKRNAVSGRESRPENLITWRTPAAFDASINVFCVSTMSTSGAEIIRTRSTPSRAGPKLLRLDMSPSTISTVGTFSSFTAFFLSLTKTRTCSRWRTNSFTIKEPAAPVAPVKTWARSVIMPIAGSRLILHDAIWQSRTPVSANKVRA